jgi:3-methyladenine DNA glycosylase/8-oxoguanine DNA glycosylase
LGGKKLTKNYEIMQTFDLNSSHSKLFDNLAKVTLKQGTQWLMPVILATWEAEIRRITVQRQPRQDHNINRKGWAQ